MTWPAFKFHSWNQKIFLFMFIRVLLIALAIAATHCNAFYSKSGDVVQLDSMQAPTKADSGVWLVEFYAPWCGHCVKAKPEMERAATALKGIAKVAAVDMTQHERLGAPYGVQGFPTFKLFSNGKVSDYNGARTAQGFVDGVTSAITALARSKLNGGGKKEQQKSSAGNPIEKLTDDNFDATVLGNTKDMYLVAFVADYCGHCKQLKPAYMAAAKKLFGTGIRFATVEGPENSQLSSRFKIQGFPTIKVFGPGAKSDKAKTYEGGRDEESIVAYATEQFEKLGGSLAVDVLELSNSQVFAKTCGKEKKCVLVVLEDLLDTSAKQRNKDLEVIQAVAKNARHLPFVWTGANSQPNIESAFGLTFGFPAVLMLREGPNGEKVGFVHRGKFNSKDLSTFIGTPFSLSTGIQVKNWPEIAKIEAWDGKSEAKPIVQDENDDFDLEAFLKDGL